MKKISVITINYNNKIGLLKTIESVFGQESDKFEYIVIDGSSTDGSVALLEENTDKITYWISEKDGGIYNAMNKGVDKAKGHYLIFLNSGDCLSSSSVIQKCYEEIKLSPLVDIFYADIFVENKSKNIGYIHNHPSALSLSFLKKESINHQAALINKQLFTEFGYYPENYKLASDYWLFLSAFIQDKNYKYMDFVMVIYDLTGMSAEDGFKQYRFEQGLIWESKIPKYVQITVEENEILLQQNKYYKNLVQYKVLKIAIALNNFYYKIRNFF